VGAIPGLGSERSTRDYRPVGLRPSAVVNWAGHSVSGATARSAGYDDPGADSCGPAGPTAADVLLPVKKPNIRLASVAVAANRLRFPPPVAQLAVWAVANNPPRAGIERYLNEVVAAVQAPPQLEKRRLLEEAADLVRAAKLKPAEFRMFW